MAGSSFIKLPKELNHQRKGLIRILKIDEYFKWCLVTYLHLADHNPQIFTKTDKDFVKKLDHQRHKIPSKN